ncbi:MAG: hypothetical protein RL058_428 [Actinomycetota bacterium]|jgi:hypothetical protein
MVRLTEHSGLSGFGIMAEQDMISEIFAIERAAHASLWAMTGDPGGGLEISARDVGGPVGGACLRGGLHGEQSAHTERLIHSSGHLFSEIVVRADRLSEPH